MPAPEHIVGDFPDNPTPEDRCEYVRGLSEEDLAAAFGDPIDYFLFSLEATEIPVPLRQYDHPEEGVAFVLGVDLVGALLRAADKAYAIDDRNAAHKLGSKANEFAGLAYLSPSTKNRRFRFSQDPVNHNSHQ